MARQASAGKKVTNSFPPRPRRFPAAHPTIFGGSQALAVGMKSSQMPG